MHTPESTAVPYAARRRTLTPTPAQAPVAIVGAGIAGLTAARELHRRGVPLRVYEAGPRIAGLSTSFKDGDGFTHDFGAHFITNRLADQVGVRAQCRDVRYYGETVFVRGRTYSFPLGLMRSPRYVAGALATRTAALARGKRPIESAIDWYRTSYGRVLADEVAAPLVEAWSGVPASELAPSVIAPQLDRGTAHVLKLKLASRLTRRAVANGYSREMPESPDVWHVYPDGGVGVLCDRLAEEVEEHIQLRSPVEAIYVDGDRAVGVRVNGEDVDASAVVSTAPVHVLAKLVRGTTALQHLARFRYRPMTLVNLRFEGRALLPDVVTWVPERRFPFFRLTEATTSMPWLAPPGKTVITADIGCEVGDATWTMPDDELARLCVEHLAAIVPDARRRFIGAKVLRTPVAYPVFLREYEEQRQALERGSPVQGLHSIGRNGEFAHILMEDVYWRTLRRMEGLAATLAGGA